MKQKKVDLSLIFPVFNEQKRITHGLKTTLVYLKKQKFSWEIIVVDDGSQDDTVKLANKLLPFKKGRIIQLKSNQGKGQAIKIGVLNAQGKYIIFSDIDLSVSITEVNNFLSKLHKYDLVIGTRRHPQSLIITHQSFIRESLGSIFTLLTKIVVSNEIYDATCGFKGFRQKTALKIFAKTIIKHWAFDAEILFLAKKYHYQIAQIPVVWKNAVGTKVNILQDGICALIDLIRIVIWDKMGKY